MGTDRHTNIRASQLRNLSLTGDDIADGTISGTKLANSTITESLLDISNPASDGYSLTWNQGQSKFEWVDVVAASGIDHGSISGLTDDDHSQYLRTDGTRALSGTWNFGSNTISGTGDFYAGNIMLSENGAISNTKNDDIDTGIETVDTFADTDGDACVWHYVVKKSTNLRAGTIVGVWEAAGDTVDYMETNTNDIGDTSGLMFAVDISANNVRLRATVTSDNWEVRVIRMMI